MDWLTREADIPYNQKIEIERPKSTGEMRRATDYYSFSQANTPEEIKELVEAGGNINDKWGNTTALLDAIQLNKDTELIKAFLQYGADVNNLKDSRMGDNAYLRTIDTGRHDGGPESYDKFQKIRELLTKAGAHY